MESLLINIWDDYHDDGYIPEGEKQETYAYVESDIPEEKKKDYLERLLDYINKNIKLPGVRLWLELYSSTKKYPHINETENPDFMKQHPYFHFSRWEIKIENLTHERREQLVDELNDAKLGIDNMPVEIISES